MKRFTCLVLCLCMLTVLASCGKKKTEYKIGMGVVTEVSGADGKATLEATVATVVTDSSGKIVLCRLDALEKSIGITNGIVSLADAQKEVKTKKEQGEDYKMKNASPIKKEWYEQADYFAKCVVGLNSSEVSALVSKDNNLSETITAGCTIDTSDFIKAIVRAVENSSSKTFKASDVKLGLGIVAETKSSQIKDAGAEDGSLNVEITISGVATDKDGVVVATLVDALESKITFNTKGELTSANTAIKTKKELGDNYGMRSVSSINKEWYEQVRAFEEYCVGLDATGINSIMISSDGKSDADALRAGCTIKISSLMRAAKKAASAAK